MAESESSNHKIIKDINAASLAKYDGILLCVSVSALKKKEAYKNLPLVSKATATATGEHAKRAGFEAKDYAGLSYDVNANQRLALMAIPEKPEMFFLLQNLRENLQPLFKVQSKQILLDLRGFDLSLQEMLCDASIAVVSAHNFTPPKYKSKKDSKPEKPKTKTSLHLITEAQNVSAVKSIAERSEQSTAATNFVRQVSLRAGNDLTCKSYVEFVKEQAKSHGLSFEFFSFNKLKDMGAGAFVAVAQGSKDKDAGIVKLQYKPKGAAADAKHLCLVGKGITFDTGGVNVKPGTYMFGMHLDMTGSAVALALILQAAKSQSQRPVTAYLAIAENAVAPDGYRPNDVVTSLSGKTIEVVHTDAEGRMVLSDTLWMASGEQPDLIVDFATLTGACVAAIGTTYSGAFTNRPEYWPHIISAGQKSGERVWPFPVDKDFGECLKSEVADIKQCRLKGGVDHIEAAYFLREFIAKDVPWVHVDLSACENDGGLAHVSTRETGFGVRFANELVRMVLGDSLKPGSPHV